MVAYREGYLDIPWSALDVYDDLAKELKTNIENQEWFTDWTEIDFDSEDFKDKLAEVFDEENTDEGFCDSYPKSIKFVDDLEYYHFEESDFNNVLGRFPKNAQEFGIVALHYSFHNTMGGQYICDKIKELALGKQED